MKIGFEAKRIFNNTTGLGHYSRTLVSSLATYFPNNQYVLFAPKQTNLFNTNQYSNLQLITPSTFPSTLLKNFWRSSWVKKDLHKQHIDIYHGLSHEIPFGIQKTKIKTVVTIHDLIFERYPEQYNKIDVQIYRKKFSYACKNANSIIAISQQTKQDIIQFYKIPEQKIHVCYQSCNASFTNVISEQQKQLVKQQYNLPNQFFLYVGSIIERKNLLLICKGLKQVQHLQIPLVVIGNGGKYKQQVKQFLAENYITNQVIFLSELFFDEDFVTAKVFPAIYQQALCMIYPSIFEGFGIPILEALYSKIPVITTNVSCMPETAGNAALYINPNNENEMANAMESIATNTQLRQNLINNGILQAQNFTQQNCATAVHKVYQKLYQL